MARARGEVRPIADCDRNGTPTDGARPDLVNSDVHSRATNPGACPPDFRARTSASPTGIAQRERRDAPVPALERRLKCNN